MWLQLGVLLLGLSVFGPVSVSGYKFHYFKWSEDIPRHPEKACAYYGYIPGGERVDISPIPPIEVEAGEDTMDDALAIVGDVTTAGNSIMTIASGMVDQLGSRAATVCPVTAGIFGLVGLVSGIWGGNRAPDPLDVMQEALDELTLYINDRLDDVVNYVDQAILDAQIGYVGDLMNECQLKWEGCLEMSITRKEGLACQIITEHAISSMRPHFMHNEDEMSPEVDNDGNVLPVPDVVPDGKWDPNKNYSQLTRQFCQELYPGLCPSYIDVRLLEGTAASFTQYATLHMYLLISIYGDYVNSTDSEVNNRTEHMRVYLEEIIHMGALYYQYARWMKSWAYIRNIWENYRCFSLPHDDYAQYEQCFLYEYDCDPSGWHDIIEKGPWGKKHNTRDYRTCWAHFNNMLPQSKCTQTLEVRVDGKGAEWNDQHDVDVVWFRTHPDSWSHHDAGDWEQRFYTVVTGSDRDMWLYVDDPQYDDAIPSIDLDNWWEANVMVEARKWQELHTTALDTLNREFGPSSTSGIKVDEAVYQQLKEELAASRQFK